MGKQNVQAEKVYWISIICYSFHFSELFIIHYWNFVRILFVSLEVGRIYIQSLFFNRNRKVFYHECSNA